MRTCTDCGVEITLRHALAYLCTKCSTKRRKARKRAYYHRLPEAIRLGRHDQPDRAPERRLTVAA